LCCTWSIFRALFDRAWNAAIASCSTYIAVPTRHFLQSGHWLLAAVLLQVMPVAIDECKHVCWHICRHAWKVWHVAAFCGLHLF
jgi:hypothetical protein